MYVACMLRLISLHTFRVVPAAASRVRIVSRACVDDRTSWTRFTQSSQVQNPSTDLRGNFRPEREFSDCLLLRMRNDACPSHRTVALAAIISGNQGIQSILGDIIWYRSAEISRVTTVLDDEQR
jgi:hypothetical protein